MLSLLNKMLEFFRRPKRIISKISTVNLKVSKIKEGRSIGTKVKIQYSSIQQKYTSSQCSSKGTFICFLYYLSVTKIAFFSLQFNAKKTCIFIKPFFPNSFRTPYYINSLYYSSDTSLSTLIFHNILQHNLPYLLIMECHVKSN